MQVEAVDEIDADKIDLDFVPLGRDSVSVVELDGEFLLADRERSRYHVLNSIGSIVWRCFDGSDNLAAIIVDLADVFEADPDVVRDDVLGLARDVGRAGLLVGVAAWVPQAAATPEGVEVGEELAAFSLPDLAGNELDTDSFRGRQALLVNWSPGCGYCVKIAPDLAAAQAELAERGVELVFVTAGDIDANETLFNEHGINAKVMVRDDSEFDDPFSGMGTPVAYLLDGEGKVAAPLAYGADAVPALAATAAGHAAEAPVDQDGHDHEGHDHEAPADGPKYIPTSSGVCGPGAGGGKKPRVWAATSTYAAGDYHIGIRANSIETDQLLRRVFAAHVQPEGTDAPENFSVVLNDSGTKASRSLNLVLQGSTTVARSRDPRRIVLALANYMSALVEADETPPDNIVRVATVGAVIGESGVLLPSTILSWIDKIQPRLNRVGVRVVDSPYMTVDVNTCELVVREPRVTIDWTALDGLATPASTRSELPMVEPGRYPLRAWGIWNSAEVDTFTRAQAVASGLGMVMPESAEPDVDHELARVMDLVSKVDTIPLVFRSPETLADAVKTRVAVLT